MTLSGLKGISCVALVSLAATNATAQTAADVENSVTTGSQFEESQILSDQQRRQSEDATILEGEPGVFILKKNEIFVFGAALGTGYTDNPGRTLDTNAEGAFYGTLALSAGVNTRIAQEVDAGINVVAAGTEYGRADAPSYRNVISNAYVGRGIFDNELYLSANASVGVNFDREFNNSTTFYSTAVNVSTIRKLSDNILFRPSISVSRQWSGQSEQNNFTFSASSVIIWQPAKKWLVRGHGSYSHRRYDDFFEDVTFVKRKDHQFRVGVAVSRQITESIDASANFDYTNQNSSFFISDYEALDGGVTLRISQRF